MNTVFDFIMKIFNTNLTSGNDTRDISLMNHTVIAERLQIRPYAWTRNPPCMRVELFGCPFSGQFHARYSVRLLYTCYYT